MTEAIQQEIPKKIIVEFKHVDEQGNPIIDPRTGQQGFTNLAADTPEEMIEKQKEAYVNVLRALARARNHKAVPRPAESPAKQLTAEEERQAAVDLADPTKARAAIRKLSGADDIERQQKELQEQQDSAASQRAAYQFMSRHLTDYFPCEANSRIMSEYIKQEDLDPRVTSNYEIAFLAIEGQLAQRPAPLALPAVHAEEPPKKQAAGGIQPGELSGPRPMQRQKAPLVTKEQIKKWRETPEGRAEYKKRLRDPVFVAAVDSLFASKT